MCVVCVVCVCIRKTTPTTVASGEYMRKGLKLVQEQNGADNNLTRPGGTTVMCGGVTGELTLNSAASIVPTSLDLCEGECVRVCV